MNLDLILTALSGGLVFSAGLALGLWQILSAPDRPNYPTSGPIKRIIMFWFMASLLYRGLEISLGALKGVYAGEGQLVSSVMVFAFFTIMLVDHLQHWLPSRTHGHIRKLLHIATCKPSPGLVKARTRAMKASTGEPCPSAAVVSPALVELALQGVKVAGPGDGPEAIL